MLLDQSSSQLLKTHFIGRDGFVWWVGQIASREKSKWDKTDLKNKKAGEELYYNRVKVRIFGYHPLNDTDLPDEQLPWAHILVPPGESNGVGKVGKAHGYQGGETVLGFFLDGDDGQQPVIFGSLYKSSEIKTYGPNSKLQPWDPYQPAAHNSLPPTQAAGQNVGTGKGSPDSPGIPSKGNSSGIENVASEKEEQHAGAMKSFADGLCSKTVQPTLCNKNRFAKITAAIESLLRKLRNYQNIANTFYKDKIRNKITDFSAEISKVSAMVAGDISSYIKQGMMFLFEKISKVLGLTFGGLFPKTKQSQIGKIIDTILEAIYAIFKKIGLSLPDLVSDALTNFVGNAIAATACAVQNFLAQVLSKILATINETILPLLDQINSLVQGALGSAANLLEQSLNLIGVISQLLNFAKPEKFCPPPTTFTMCGGIDVGSVVSDMKALVNGVGNVGKLAGKLGSDMKDFGDLKLDLNSCNPKKEVCGPPKFVITGGGGDGAAATPIVNSLGKIVGAILTNPGKDYTSAPNVSIIDECGLGDGAQAIAIMKQIPPNSQYPPGSPKNPTTSVEKIIILEPGNGYLNSPQIQEYGGADTNNTKGITGDTKSYVGIVTDVEIVNPGYGYDNNTIVSVGECATSFKLGPDGEFVKVTVEAGCNVDDLPEVTINSENGAAAQLVPVLSFVEVGVTTTAGISTGVLKVINCV